MIINNSISQDTIDERWQRVSLLSANIDTYAVELDVTGARLTWAQGAASAWETARATAHVESGEMNEAYQTYNQAFEAASKYYNKAKEFLIRTVVEISGPDDDILQEYRVDRPTPLEQKGLVSSIEDWKITHDRLKAAGDPRVVNDAIVANLMTHRNTIVTLWHDAEQERQESTDAYKTLHALYDTDSRALGWLLGLCFLVWGDDDSRLRLLGFVPSSEIWTKHKPHAPKNFIFDDVAKRFNWDAVEGVDSYEVDFRLTGATMYQLVNEMGSVNYIGAKNEFGDMPSEPQQYRVRAGDGTMLVWGEWTAWTQLG